MRKFIPLLVIALVVSVSSCKENLCENVTCYNGGACEDGKCQCPSGFTGADCSVHTNPCDTMVCYNGGICNNGVCACPAHTSGANCSVQETPAHMAITRLVVAHFNPTDSLGNLWDASDYADIYPIIKKDGNIIYNGTPWRKNNANYDSWYDWVLGNDSIIFTDITNPNYRMELWDYDGGGSNDQYMEGYNFTPYSPTGGFPGSITLTDTTFYHNKFELRVYFEHSW